MKPEIYRNHEFEEIKGLIQFLSAITGLPVTHASIFPELKKSASYVDLLNGTPLELILKLGDTNCQYQISIIIEFNSWQKSADITWKVAFNEEELSHAGYNIGITAHTRDDVIKILHERTRSVIGQPDTEVAFMDYETYTLENLNEEYAYFKNIYLILMTHMKQKGLPLPPILSKRPEIVEPMMHGNTKEVERILRAIFLLEVPSYDQRCQAHLRYEAEEIRQQVSWEQQRRDPQVPLIDAFPNLDDTVVENGRSTFSHTILVVESDLFGNFRNTVTKALETDGRYKETHLISDCILHNCMRLCETGKIDLVIFDWTNPAYWEVLTVRGKRNPLFDMTYGNDQAVLELDEEKFMIATPDGKVYDEETLRQKAEKVDIRARWMKMIATACQSAGVTVPSHFIVRSLAEHKDIAKIISQKLGHPLR